MPVRDRLDFAGAVAYVAASGMVGAGAWWLRTGFRLLYRPL